MAKLTLLSCVQVVDSSLLLKQTKDLKPKAELSNML